MPNTPLRRFAALLLRAAIRFAPCDAREWGHAALAELGHVEGNWAAVAWALGGAGVLAKQTLLALVMPWRNRQAVPIGNPLLREAKMHKGSLIAGGACLAAAILFFVAPVFRQGFRVSLAQWSAVVHTSQNLFYTQTELQALARRAEKKRDAKGMAFVAARLYNGKESVQLASEAVRLDPKLIWIWAVVGTRHAAAPDVPVWANKLKQRDPGNALPDLILAERADITSTLSGGVSFLHRPGPSAAWMEAMAGAFNSKRLDEYMEQRQALARTVAQRYGFSDPYLVVERAVGPMLPSYALADSYRYAKLMMASGDKLEASGNAKGAVEKYLGVAHFVHMLDAAHNHPFYMNRIMPDVFARLAAAYKKIGTEPQSDYYADLATATIHNLDQRYRGEHSAMLNRLSAFGVTGWSALVVELSNAGMLASFCLLLVALIVVLAQSRTAKSNRLQMGPVATGLGFLGSIGLLVSSVALYVAYRPYAAIYSNFIHTGDASQLATLRDFLIFTRSPIGTQMYRHVSGHHEVFAISPYVSTQAFTFCFWLAVTVAGLAGLAVIGGRHLLKHSPRHASAA